MKIGLPGTKDYVPVSYYCTSSTWPVKTAMYIVLRSTKRHRYRHSPGKLASGVTCTGSLVSTAQLSKTMMSPIRCMCFDNVYWESLDVASLPSVHSCRRLSADIESQALVHCRTMIRHRWVNTFDRRLMSTPLGEYPGCWYCRCCCADRSGCSKLASTSSSPRS